MRFVIVAKCKQGSKVLVYSSFAGPKMHGCVVNKALPPLSKTLFICQVTHKVESYFTVVIAL